MQKLVTLAIDIEELKESASGAFTITEVGRLNELLQDRWAIQEWEFLTNDTEEEKAILLVILDELEPEEDFDDSLFIDAEDEDEEEKTEDEESGSEELAEEESDGVRTTARSDYSMN